MAKKDFKNTSQADILLGKAKAPGTITETAEPGKETKKIELITPKERKTEKILLALKPSLYKAIKEQARLNKLSLNETCSQLLEMALKQ